MRNRSPLFIDESRWFQAEFLTSKSTGPSCFGKNAFTEKNLNPVTSKDVGYLPILNIPLGYTRTTPGHQKFYETFDDLIRSLCENKVVYIRGKTRY